MGASVCVEPPGGSATRLVFNDLFLSLFNIQGQGVGIYWENFVESVFWIRLLRLIWEYPRIRGASQACPLIFDLTLACLGTSRSLSTSSNSCLNGAFGASKIILETHCFSGDRGAVSVTSCNEMDPAPGGYQ